MDCDIDTFVWSKDCPLLELLGKYEEDLPFFVVVTDGYFGRDTKLHMIASDQIYWLYSVEHQRCVVGRYDGQLYSIPSNHPTKVNAFWYSGKELLNITVEEMINDDCDYFTFLTSDSLNVYEGAGSGRKVQFGKVEVEDIHSEPYLVGHSLGGGELSAPESIIPLYMPISLSRATGLAKGTQGQWERLQNKFMRLAQSFKHVGGSPCSDIMIFKGKTENTYDYIEPKKFSGPPGSAPMPYVQMSKGTGHTQTKATGSTIPPSLPRRPDQDLPPPVPERKPAGKHQQIGSPSTQKVFSSYQNLDTSCAASVTSASPSTATVAAAAGSKGPKLRHKDKHDSAIIEQYELVEDRPATDKNIASELGKRFKVLLHGDKPTPKPAKVAEDVIKAAGKSVKAATPSSIGGGASVSLSSNIGTPRTNVRGDHLKVGKSDKVKAGLIAPPSTLPKPTSKQPKAPATAAQGSLCSDITSLDDVPNDLGSLSVEQVCQCLELLHMSKYIDRFRMEEIDGALLHNLDEEILKDKDGLGIDTYHAMKLVRFIKGWRPRHTRTDT